MESLRCMYELPYLRHFICTETEKEKYGFPSIDIRGLEEGLSNEHSHLFADLICCFLRHIKQNPDIRIDGYESHLKDYLEENKSEHALLLKSSDANSLQPTDKLKMLKWIVDQTKTRDKKNEYAIISEDSEMASLDTVINAGQDSENRTYWYFDDLRLYRQKNGQPRTNCDWQCIATNVKEWETLIDQFSKSKDDQEKELHTYLKDSLYPIIKTLLQSQSSAPLLPTNEELLRRERGESIMTDSIRNEKSPSAVALDPEVIKSENPELSKVLSEEPSAGRSSSSHLNGNAKKSGGIAFSQQQSQLFVFSTTMANRAADAVMSGEQKSILSYHLEDPDTKSFLQANQMKVTLPNPQARLPPHPVRPTNPYRQPRAIPPIPVHPSSQHSQWNGSMRPVHPGYNGPPGHYANRDMNSSPMSGPPHMGGQPDISQRKVPDEVLTPEQRQHREDQLASLRKIQQMLLADGQTSDFKDIYMAQDRQDPYVPPNQFGINQQAMSMYGGSQMSPANNPGSVEQKPPPPYPMPMSSPGTNTIAPKKTRKRKNSSLPSPAPGSPHSQPPIKQEKPSVPPSPLANPQHMNQTGPLTPQAGPMTPQPGGPVTPQPMGPQTPQPMSVPESGPHSVPGVPQAGPMHQITRQQSMPNFSMGRTGPPPNAYPMMQAGQPTPYQNPAMGSGDAPPSYNVTVRRGMSIESMTAPPSHRQQYLQPENQERLIERQLNISHHSNMTSFQSSYSEQQSIYSSSSQANMHQTSASDSTANLSNITSASLANLCKGVEQNFSQMSQISKNGPYGDIPPPISSAAGHHGESGPPPMSSGSQGPSVNNTYVNAHMSIGQVNIQNVTANQNYQGPGMPRHMQQNVDVSMNNFNGNMMPQHPPEPIYKPQQAAAPAVSIQNKGRNTISYLPVSQPSLPSSHEPAIPPKASFDFMPSERYPSPSPGFYPPDGGPGGPVMGPQVSPHNRHPGPMYGGPHQGGPMMPNGGPPGMHMGDSMGPRHPSPHYMMSASHNSMSMGYSQGGPPPPAGHPGMMESHHVHMRNSPMMMHQSGPMNMPPHSYAGHGGYGPPPPGPNMPYHPQPGEYMPGPGGHHMPPSRGPPMHQQMMMSHQGGPYMNSPGPPYM